jgi:hypothetical protein
MVGLLSSLPITTSGSSLLGTGGAQSVLGLAYNGTDGAAALFGNIGSTTNSLMTQIRANAEHRIAEAKAQIDDLAQQRNDAINVQNERWISVKAQVNNAEIAVQNGQEAAGRVESTLLEMRTSITNTGEPGEDPKFWKEMFDGQVNKINIEADNGSPASNLVGNINRLDNSPNQIEYRNDLGAGSTTLTGTYIGSDFRIEANDGTVWIPDLGSDILQAYSGGGEAQKYTVAGKQIDKATSTRNGLQLVSYNAQTKQITVSITIVPDDPPIVVTGTLKKAGIGIMQSWFYNGFASEADRKRARTDVNAAEVNLVSAQADLQRSAVQTGIDQKRVNRALDDLTSQTGKVRTQQMEDTQELQVKTAQQYLAMQSNLQNLTQVQNNYLQAFAGFIDDPFAQATLNLIA